MVVCILTMASETLYIETDWASGAGHVTLILAAIFQAAAAAAVGLRDTEIQTAAISLVMPEI